MLKIFSTQLSGVFKAINDDEFAFEDAARLLAQAAVGDGTIYIAGFAEMKGLIPQATEGTDALPSCKPFNQLDGVTTADRVLLAVRHHNDPEAIKLAKDLYDRQIPFVAMSTVVNDENGIQDWCDVHLDLRVKRGLVPADNGGRIGFPALMAALYAYHGIHFTLTELLEEYQD
ncbi:DUF2529 domain-containing protein [Bacillus testis]|uniref:DUF2529 domain-containing protein n=1 Tax=Bacillus testis TaxID=1622072 RepID=UPI00067E6C45|nr:DUF2529 domain-containing protein [Bacillus testis]